MKNYIRIALGLLLMVFLLSCGHSDDSGIYKFPLEIGNSWTMRVINTQSSSGKGTKETEVSTLFFEADSTVMSPTHVETIRLKAHLVGKGKSAYFYTYVKNQPDGLYEYGYSSGEGYIPLKGGMGLIPNPLNYGAQITPNKTDYWHKGEPVKLIPYDQPVGYTWDTPDDSYMLDMTYTLLPDTTITVPLGKVKCHKKQQVFNEITDFEIYYYYSNRGIIKHRYSGTQIETDEQGNYIGYISFETTMELTNYQLN